PEAFAHLSRISGRSLCLGRRISGAAPTRRPILPVDRRTDAWLERDGSTANTASAAAGRAARLHHRTWRHPDVCASDESRRGRLPAETIKFPGIVEMCRADSKSFNRTTTAGQGEG